MPQDHFTLHLIPGKWDHIISPLDIKNSESIRTTIDSTTDIVDDSTSDSDGFIGVKRRRANVKKFFLSGIADTVTTETILDYLQKRNIHPTQLRLFSSRR